MSLPKRSVSYWSNPPFLAQLTIDSQLSYSYTLYKTVSVPVYTDTCSLAYTDPLANPDCTQTVGHPDLLSSVFTRWQNTYVQYLCNLHCACTWHGCRVTWGLTYFSGSQGLKMYQSHFGTTTVAQVLTAVHRHFESCTRRPITEP